jgi:hypothetical protein
MMKHKISGFLLCLTLLLGVNAPAQEVEVGVMGGGTYYLGELNPGRQFSFTKPAFGGVMRFNLDTRWAVKFGFLYGKLAGDDAVSKANEMRNLRFTSPITELSLVGEFNFLDYFTGSQVHKFTPFLFLGPGFFIFKPQAEFNGETVNLQDLGTEGQISDSDKYSLYGLAMVFGVGVKYSVNDRLGLGLEWGLRKTFTDYIDDVSTQYYIDYSEVTSPGDITAKVQLSDPSTVKHEPGMQRGNPQNNDWYSFAGVTITYRFRLGEKTTCSDFEN